MTSTSAFSSEDDVTKRRLELVPKTATETSKLYDVYDLDMCREWIQRHGYKRVALQFPDDLLVDSVPVQRNLQDKLVEGTAVFILGDTSYGSCCVDEVAAEHGGADSLVHFGGTCLSPTQRLPVLYVLCSRPVDQGHAADQLWALCPDPAARLIIVADTMYQHAVDPLAEALMSKYSEVVTSELKMPSSAANAKDSFSSQPTQATMASGNSVSSLPLQDVNLPVSAANSKDGDSELCGHCQCNRRFALPKDGRLEDYSVVYIGEEGKVLTNLMMTMNTCKFLSYDPERRMARRESLQVNRELMKRFYMIERAKDARLVGIVAGTLGVAGTPQAIAHLRALLRAAGKKTYTFVVGKLNVAKLANFLEVDVFVLVACPINTLIDSKEFFKPVVTPFEMELACNTARPWTGHYLTDFQVLLPGAAEYIPAVAPALDTTDLSLVSNKLRTLGQRSADGEGEGSSTVMLRSDALTVASHGADTASEFLSSRSWQGLERKLGETPVEKAKEGRSGIAMCYDHEPKIK